jgi:hypothetical protein
LKAEGMKFTPEKILIPVTATFLSAMLGGCSTGSTSDPSPSPSASKGVAADHLCAGLLGADGASALEQVTQSQRFIEIQGAKGLVAATSALRHEADFTRHGSQVNLCLPNTAGSRTNGSLEIYAQWLKTRPNDYNWISNQDSTVFDIVGDGKKDSSAPYAYGAPEFSGILFHCPQGPGTEKDTVLTMNVSSSHLNDTQNSQAPALMTRIAYAAAVSTARKMGCFQESGLPERLGTLKKFA